MTKPTSAMHTHYKKTTYLGVTTTAVTFELTFPDIKKSRSMIVIETKGNGINKLQFISEGAEYCSWREPLWQSWKRYQLIQDEFIGSIRLNFYGSELCYHYDFDETGKQMLREALGISNKATSQYYTLPKDKPPLFSQKDNTPFDPYVGDRMVLGHA